MTTQNHGGSAWLRRGQITNLSPLGEAVADLLGDLLGGLYHLDGAASVDWSNPSYIEVRWPSDLSTFDSNTLTRLVLLAHDRAIRVDISPRSNRYLTMLFHQRRHGADLGIWERHPTAEDALAEHRRWYPAPETKEAADEAR